MYYYLRYMGCVAWTIALVILVILIKKTSRTFKDNYSTKKDKVKDIFLLLGDLIFGSAVGVLFYVVAGLVK